MIYTFVQHAVIAVIVVSLASAIIGTYVVARRMVSITGGITHASFGGLGFGFWAGCNPVIAAMVAAIAAALGIELMSSRSRVREDTAIGVVWSLGMAIGTFFIFLTPGYVPELTSFLFGNLLTITVADLTAGGIYLAVLVVLFSFKGETIVACAFDRDFATTQGLPVRLVNTVMTMLVAIGVVLTSRLIGIMLLLSLITLPQLSAECFVRRLKPMMLISCAISLFSGLAGLAVSYCMGTPASATIVILLIVVYCATKTVKYLSKK